MEVVDSCRVRIKGVATQRYLAMGANGTLVSQVCISDKIYLLLTTLAGDQVNKRGEYESHQQGCTLRS